jgi:DNA-binding NtrC family response regulator
MVDVSEGPVADFVCLGCVNQIFGRELKTARDLAAARNIPVVLLTLRGSEELAVQALRCGITDYLRVPFSRDELESIILSVCPGTRTAGLVKGENLVGESRAVQDIKAYIEKVGRTTSSVLITGETGTGKELIADLIHSNSPRAGRPLICVNCAAIPDTLLESELFGYERGAFTGAQTARDGKLTLANGGTLFLDEIGDMSPYAQAKLLRAIESHEVQRLGGHKTHTVDFRLIAATNRNLDSPADHDLFRRDLFFRLNVARIHLPPLRERKEDILPLSHFFRRKENLRFGRETRGFTPRAEQVLLQHDWPGNVRELRNIVEAAFIDLDAGATLVSLPAPFCAGILQRERIGSAELDRILMALSETRWNKSQAAQKLHWSRMTLYRKISRYKISDPAKEILPLKAAAEGQAG